MVLAQSEFGVVERVQRLGTGALWSARTDVRGYEGFGESGLSSV
jgi:hypothetical protein